LLLIPCPLSYRSEIPEVADANHKPAILADVFFGEGEQGFGAGFILFIAVDVSTSDKLNWLH
jgi:hypothetical protein